jgi:ankyrin repeat protein
MIDRGANINCRDRWGGTPLSDAQRGGHTAIAAYLLGLGALATSDPGPSEGERMCRAAARGELEEIRQLVASSASVNAADYDRRSALHLAAAEGHDATVRYLVAERADVRARDRWGSDPLGDAVRGGHSLVQAILVEAGAQLEVVASLSLRPLLPLPLFLSLSLSPSLSLSLLLSPFHSLTTPLTHKYEHILT